VSRKFLSGRELGGRARAAGPVASVRLPQYSSRPPDYASATGAARRGIAPFGSEAV